LAVLARQRAGRRCCGAVERGERRDV